MDRLQAFYETARGLPLASRDRDARRQLKIGQTAFALSFPTEAAAGALGTSAIVSGVLATVGRLSLFTVFWQFRLGGSAAIAAQSALRS